ncbi:MAG: pilus assembly protein N-terminal domain-containing protein [Candidatus Omnitrophota bacterium]|nr:pilus assembly protein N-terminal domain-containing protein [Candidatus Omnitrophota bacterium]
MKKIFITLAISVLLTSSHITLYAFREAPAFLCEIGIQLYNAGRYDEALHEFKKALLVEPGYQPAIKYIRIIEKGELSLDLHRQEITPEEEKSSRLVEVSDTLELLEIEKLEKEADFRLKEKAASSTAPALVKKVKSTLPQIPAAPKILYLDENFADLIQPFEIEQGKSIIVSGKNIRRFLATQPEILTLEKKNTDELSVTGKNIGYTYLHVWDDNGRWTLQVLGVQPKPEGPTYEEEMLAEEAREKNFKLRYSIDWSSFEQGPSFDKLDRQSYSYGHSLGLTGAIPYGKLDSSLIVRSLRETTDLTYFTVGLDDGEWLNFKDFSLRAFDFAPTVRNLASGSNALRGVNLGSPLGIIDNPILGDNLNYEVFWGREGGGRFGNLSPGLSDLRDRFLSGASVSFKPGKKDFYGISVFHGWGNDREGYLPDYTYDFQLTKGFKDWGYEYEFANDTDYYAQLLTVKYLQPHLRFSSELRDIDQDFYTIVGLASRAGELGGLFNLESDITPKLKSALRLDIFRNRLFPSEDNPTRFNEDFDFKNNYKFDDFTTLQFDYSLQNELGGISEFRSHNGLISFSHTFEKLRKLSSYFTYQFTDASNFSATSLSYQANKLISGFSLPLVAGLYYRISKEMNWTREKMTGKLAKPHAWETGIDWSRQFLDSKFTGNIRLSYRDEQDAEATLSFLSGEDYLEGYSELNYRPSPGTEAYISGRMRNVWADKADVLKRNEVDFRAGMRYLWDTGIKWPTIGNIEGIIYKDLNSDGLRQNDEPPVEGVKVYLGPEKSATTDIFGRFRFNKIKAKQVDISVDTTTIPSGYILTVPAAQSVPLRHGRASEVNFGISANSEIIGVIFLDNDGDGKLSPKDKGVGKVKITLDDNIEISTDDSGRYFFRRISPGKHNFNMDINTLPIEYLPQAAISKEIELGEGVSVSYNIPLKKIK